MKDMNKKQQDKLKQLFEELGNEAVPASGDPWHALQQRLSLQNPRQRQRQKGEQLEMPSQSQSQPEPIAVNTGYDPASRALRRPRRSRNMTILAGLTLVIVGVTAFIAFLALGIGAPAPGPQTSNPSIGSGSPPSVVPAVNVTATPGPTETPPPTPTTLSRTTTPVPEPETTSTSVTPLPVASPTPMSQTLPPPPAPTNSVTAIATATAATTRQPSPSTAPLTSTTKPAMTATATRTAITPTPTPTPDFNKTALALLNGSDWRILPNGTGTVEQNRRYLIAYQPSTVPVLSQDYIDDGWVSARAVALVQQDSTGKPFIAFTADMTTKKVLTSKTCLTNIPGAALTVQGKTRDDAQRRISQPLGFVALDAAGTPLIQGYGVGWDTTVQDYRLVQGPPDTFVKLNPENCK
jgi:hypothetical protein